MLVLIGDYVEVFWLSTEPPFKSKYTPTNYYSQIASYCLAQRLARKPLGRLCRHRFIILTLPSKNVPTKTLSRRPSRLNALVGRVLLFSIYYCYFLGKPSEQNSILGNHFIAGEWAAPFRHVYARRQYANAPSRAAPTKPILVIQEWPTP
jgi:hypothetical protein